MRLDLVLPAALATVALAAPTDKHGLVERSATNVHHLAKRATCLRRQAAWLGCLGAQAFRVKVGGEIVKFQDCGTLTDALNACPEKPAPPTIALAPGTVLSVSSTGDTATVLKDGQPVTPVAEKDKDEGDKKGGGTSEARTNTPSDTPRARDRNSQVQDVNFQPDGQYPGLQEYTYQGVPQEAGEPKEKNGFWKGLQTALATLGDMTQRQDVPSTDYDYSDRYSNPGVGEYQAAPGAQQPPPGHSTTFKSPYEQA